MNPLVSPELYTGVEGTQGGFSTLQQGGEWEKG